MRRFLTITCTDERCSSLHFPAALAPARQRKTSKTQESRAGFARFQRGVDTITAAQMRDYLSFIASDEMEGRDTPSRGLDITAKFLAMNLARWGFKPAGDDGTFFQKIALSRDVIDKAETRVQLNDQTAGVRRRLHSACRGRPTLPAPLVFAGNGWFVKSKNIDAYKGIDAKGKIAVIFAPPDGYPRGISAC